MRPHARFVVSTPESVGTVLRRDALAPGGVDLPLAPPPPARPPAPLPAGPPPVVRSLSYTALALWKRCGYRFYLQRVLRLPEEDEPGARPAAREADGRLEARLRGTLAHEALERDGDARTLVLEAAQRHGVTLTGDELDDIAGMVAGFATSELGARVARAGRVRREHTFTFPLGSTMLTGFVDVMAQEDDGTVLVVDYKTDRLKPGDTPQAVVERDYDVQRRLYALAVLRHGAPGVEVAYAFLERPGEPLATTYVPDDVPRLERELEELARGVHEGRFAVAAEPHIALCAGCPGRKALCSWPEELTGRELPAVSGS
jgi:RecB family exonuclease